jgi:hypothetical protein
MSVAGTHVSAAEVVSGEMLTFTTTGDVAELRTRVHRMAAVHDERRANAGAREGAMTGGMMEPGHAVSGTMMPPSRATATDVEGGSSIVLEPSSPADLDKLRIAVQMRAQRLEQSGCGTTGHMIGG